MVRLLKRLVKGVLYCFFRATRPISRTFFEAQEIGDPAFHSFIGYYDIQPFSRDESKIVCNRCPSKHNGRAMDVPLEVGYVELSSGEFHLIDTVPVWCWQQGCRLQWVMWKGQEVLLYNTLRDGALCTVLYDVEQGAQVDALPYATYALSGDGAYVATLDFDYLERCRSGYGYDWKDMPDAPPTFFEIYNTQDSSLRARIGVEDVLEISPHESMFDDRATHYFNHLHFNPLSNRLMVFHIWDIAGKRRVRALTLNLDGTDIRDVTGGTHVSHYWWMDDQHLLFYGTDLQHGMGFHIYKQDGGYVRSLSKDMPRGDGHPSFNPVDVNMVLSDSLVNLKSERDLWLYDMVQEKRMMLGHFYSPPQYSGAIRCDLHPRWSVAGTLVSVDSTHDGYRKIVVIDPAKPL